MSEPTSTTALGLVEMTAQSLTESTNAANALVSRITALTADPGNLIADIRNNEATEDEQVRKFQAWREAALAKIDESEKQIDEYIKANLMPKQGEEGVDVDALKTEYAALKAHISAGLKFLADVPNAEDNPAVKAIPALKSLRGGTVSSGGASGTKRPRVNDILVTYPGETEPKSTGRNVKDKDGNEVFKANFTFAAQDITKHAGVKVEVKDLQAAAFDTAKTDDLSTLNGEPVEFHYNIGTGDDMKTYNVKVYPRSGE